MSQSFWIGKTLGGRYKIEELLGQGGMSAVYKATDPNLRRAVAIKMIHSHLSSDPGFVRRFEEEATAVAQLRHPNIVQVYDFNHDDDIYYMVLEFIPGETLQDHLRRLNNAERRLPLKDVIFYAAGICDAIDYAHIRGLIHRDIKPANIMLSVMGQAILMDFGIAKIIGGQQHTASGAVVGTAMYMSPEQIKGENPDRRSDIYSMGVTLFEMVSGHPPFEADSAMSLMMMHINDPVPDLRKIYPDVPTELISIINRSLEKSTSARFQTAADMAAALRQTQEPRTLQPGGVTAPEGTWIEPTKSGEVGAEVYQLKDSPATPSEAMQVEQASKGGTGTGAEISAPVSTNTGQSAVGPSTAESVLEGNASNKNVGRRPAFLLGSILAVFALLCLVAGGFLVYSNFIAPNAGGGNPQNPAGQYTATTETIPIVSAPDASTSTQVVAITTATGSPTGTPTPTLVPTETLTPTPTIPAGIPFSRINAITIEADHYVVEYETFEFTEKISATTLHVHFFFDTVPPEEAGIPGQGPWKLYGGPRPFKDYLLSNRPLNATKMCILVANPNHSVQPNSGNCVQLPDVIAPATPAAAH
jgi:serine/threonine protein kinase